MTQCISAEEIIDRFNENNLKFEVLHWQNGVFALILERGGRVLGPFLDQKGESLLWVNPALADKDKFKDFLASGHWNIGGDRNWIAPEIQYLIGDRNNVAATVHIPAQMDPGSYLLERTGPDRYRLIQEMTLEAHNLASGTKRLHMQVSIHKAEDPLRYLANYSALVDQVTYFGYEQEVTFAEDHSDQILSELWNVIQLYPGGEIILPISAGFAVTDYIDQKVNTDYQHVYRNHVRLKITGDRMYKAGYQAAHHAGRLAYYHERDPQNAMLIVRNFYNNPSSIYIEEPYYMLGHKGDSIHIYNDDGFWGGFGELEVHGQTIGGSAGKSSSTDPFGLWYYLGAPERIRQIAIHLLGVDLAVRN